MEVYAFTAGSQLLLVLGLCQPAPGLLHPYTRGNEYDISPPGRRPAYADPGPWCRLGHATVNAHFGRRSTLWAGHDGLARLPSRTALSPVPPIQSIHATVGSPAVLCAFHVRAPGHRLRDNGPGWVAHGLGSYR